MVYERLQLRITHLVLYFDYTQPSVTPSEKDPSWSFTELPSQTTSKPTQETKSDVGLQPSKVETKASGRQKIPEVTDVAIGPKFLCF